MPAAHAILVALVALVLAGLVNGSSLERLAARQPFGTGRDLVTSAAGGARSVGDALGLDLPREALDELVGRQPPVSDAASFGEGVHRAQPPTTPPPRPTVPDDRPPAGPVTTAPPAPPTTTTVPERRVPTAEAPVRVLFAGDSLVGNIAVGFERAFRGDDRLAVARDVQVATGLARPDVLDWPAHLTRLLDGHDPEVVVLMFGANDDQDMATPDGRVRLYSEEWQREYQRRVGIMMDVARDEDRTVVWLGLPAVNRGRLERARQMMNQIALVEAGLRPEVAFVDLSAVLSPDGAYRSHVDGLRVCEDDGVHVTIAGAERLAPTILDAFAAERLPSG